DGETSAIPARVVLTKAKQLAVDFLETAAGTSAGWIDDHRIHGMRSIGSIDAVGDKQDKRINLTVPPRRTGKQPERAIAGNQCWIEKAFVLQALDRNGRACRS